MSDANSTLRTPFEKFILYGVRKRFCNKAVFQTPQQRLKELLNSIRVSGDPATFKPTPISSRSTMPR